MRLTLVAHDVGGVGGMERVLAELVAGLIGRGHHVTVISRTCRVPCSDRLRWVRVPGPRRPFTLAYPWFFLVGSLLVRRHRVGAVVTTGAIIGNRVDWSAAHLCHHAAGALGATRVSRRRPTYRANAWLARQLSRFGERFCYRPSRTGGLIGVSTGVSAELARHFPEMPIATVPNGVELAAFRPSASARSRTRLRHGLASDELVALFVGSEWNGKGLRSAIAGVAGSPNWKLMVVGRGDLASYRRIAEEVGAAGRVLFVGPQSDPAPYYQACDAFVLPSAYETFSLVTYEAAASELPLLVTPVSGVTDVLIDGENGWFISADPSTITERLKLLGDDPALRRRMGRAGREAASRFAWPRMVEHYIRLLTRATNAAGSRHDGQLVRTAVADDMITTSSA